MEGTKICDASCCGCSACMSICPKSAIIMEEDDKGFLHPIVDDKLCINCGLCQKTCNMVADKNMIQDSYIIKHKNDVQHMLSQSGGAFSVITESILKENGVIYGVTFDENFEVRFGRADIKEDCEKMYGSKYMQAKVDLTYRNVEKDLSDRKVLFAGTPCQVSGLKKYLQSKKVSTDKLYTIDLICHGVPSVLVWRKIKKMAEEKVGKIQQVIWRDKNVGGWGSNISSFYGREKYTTDAFFNIFWTNLCLRESCYSCSYTTFDRCGDITIGDAWGVKENDPDFADSRGVSLMLVNSSKGQELFRSIEDKIDHKAVDISKYAQPNMKHPSKPHRDAAEFWRDYKSKSFSFIIKKYAENNLLLNYKYVIKKGINAVCKRR